MPGLGRAEHAGAVSIADNNATPPPGTPPPAEPAQPAASRAQQRQRRGRSKREIIDRLTRSNQDLLDLLKQQQAVLEDIQYDRRLQNRQITLIEQRLEDTLQLNAALQAKVAKLQAERAAARAQPKRGGDGRRSATAAAPASRLRRLPYPPPPPASYLPPPEHDRGARHDVVAPAARRFRARIRNARRLFHIAGKQWRVLWHNQDRPGDCLQEYQRAFHQRLSRRMTAFPRRSARSWARAGDNTEITGSGDYYLKIEASGGHWEAAVEDFRGDGSE